MRFYKVTGYCRGFLKVESGFSNIEDANKLMAKWKANFYSDVQVTPYIEAR